MEKKVITFLISALFLYLAGVLTGAYLGSSLAIDVVTPLQLKSIQLESKINELEEQLNSSVYTLFILQLLSDKEVACKMVEDSLEPLLSEISEMVRYLPPRLEEARIPQDLESRYSSLNVKAYVAASFIYNNCGGKKLPVLYIYEHENVDAGKIVDRLKEEYNIMVFVAWKGADDPLIRALSIGEPSLYICNELVAVEGADEVIEGCLKHSSYSA